MIIDPFANNSKIATVTNDLNPDFNTDFHLDAFDFLKMFDNNSIDVVLYDFPYSTRQVSESYKNVGKEVTALDTSANWRKKTFRRNTTNFKTKWHSYLVWMEYKWCW